MSTLSDYRKVANIETLEWELIEEESSSQMGNTWWFNLSYDHESGEGSYLYKMDPKTKSKTHLHKGPEEFFILEGDLTDTDGYIYKKGDFVQLSSGSSHSSSTSSGCTAVVTHRGKYIFTEK
jgi:anti-sigma factor ChrR (cupin superfamily)